MNNCWIFPQILNKNNEKVDSKLFKDIYDATNNNRSISVELYQKLKNPEFLEIYGKNLIYDDNYEPTLASIYKNVNIKNYINQQNLQHHVEEKYKYGDNHKWLSQDEAFKQAMSFNTSSEYNKEFIAISNRDVVKLYPHNQETINLAKKLAYADTINNKLYPILKKAGIGVGVLTKLEEKTKQGKFDPNAVKNLKDNLIYAIKLSTNETAAKEALAEEFSHALIASTKQENQLVARLLNLIKDNNLVSSILGEKYNDYVSLYDNNIDFLVEEAAGQLLARNFYKQNITEQTPYKNLLQRILDFFKQAFSKITVQEIQDAFVEADKVAFELAKNVLSEDFQWFYDPKTVMKNLSFASLQTNTDSLSKKLEKLYQIELKRYKIYKQKNIDKSIDWNLKQQELLSEIEEALLKKQYTYGISLYLSEAVKTLNGLSIKLNRIALGGYDNLEDRAFALRQSKNYLSSYSIVLKEINDYLALQKVDESFEKLDDITIENVKKVSHLVNELTSQFNQLALPQFAKFLSQFLGEGALKKIAANLNKESITIEEFLSEADRDIGFIDRFLDSLSYSRDVVLNLYGKILNRSKTFSRLKTIELSKKVKAMQFKLEKAGIKNTEWMFAKNINGEYTGNIIRPINYNKYDTALENKLKELNVLFPNHLTNFFEQTEYTNSLNKWKQENTELIKGNFKPKMSLYADVAYSKLSKAQLEYYNDYLEIMDSFVLPENVKNNYRVPQIRKFLVERVKNSTSIKNGSKEIWEGIKDQWIRREDDTEFGTLNTTSTKTIKDFEGREVLSLPIYFVKKLDDMSQLSTDLSSTLLAFGSMAYDYEEMNKIVNSLELGREVLRSRQIKKTRGGKLLQETITEHFNTITEPLTESGDQTKIMQKLNDLMESQLYQRTMKDEGTFGNSNIDINKAARNLAKYTTTVGLGLHFLNDVANNMTAVAMTNTEAASGQYFSVKNLFDADKKYWRDIKDFLPDIGSRNQTSKIALWGEKFNVLQNFEEQLAKTEFYRKTKAGRLFNSSLLFFVRSCGNHWINFRTSLALAERLILVDNKGHRVSLYDAYEVVPIVDNGQKVGAQLQLKKGLIKENWLTISKKQIYTIEDLNFIKDNGVVTDLQFSDSEFQEKMTLLVNSNKEFTEEDVNNFSRKIHFINQFLNGSRGQDYKDSFQRTAVGKLVMIFRSWMRNTYAKRWGASRYISEADIEFEGFYRTLGRFLKEVYDLKFNIAAVWHTLSPNDLANMKRAIAELAQLSLIFLAVGFIDWGDDNNESTWLQDQIEYQLRRNLTEIGVVTPTPLMLTEFIRIVKSPTAAVNVVESAMSSFKLLWPSTWLEEVQSGTHKGWNKGVDIATKLIPGVSGISKFIDPGGSLQFQKNNKL